MCRAEEWADEEERDVSPDSRRLGWEDREGTVGRREPEGAVRPNKEGEGKEVGKLGKE